MEDIQKKPFFSILTPVYNVEKFITESIESVLKQTFTDWELILVDDGSTDTSGKICDEYAAKYLGKIKVFHKQNEGSLATRRYAFARAQGEHYVMLDSDDFLAPETLQTIYNTFTKYNCDFIVFGLADIVNGKTVKVSDQEPVLHLTDKRSFYRKVLFDSQYNSLCRKAFKANCVSLHNYKKTIIHGEDLLQSLDILHNSNSVVFIPDVLYRYRLNPSSITHTPNTQAIADFLEVSQAVVDFLHTEQVFTEKDFQDLYKYYVSLLEEKIKYIARLPFPYTDKVQIMKTIKEHNFYKEFFTSGKYKPQGALLYRQFRSGLFGLLIAEIKLYSYFQKVFR